MVTKKRNDTVVYPGIYLDALWSIDKEQNSIFFSQYLYFCCGLWYNTLDKLFAAVWQAEKMFLTEWGGKQQWKTQILAEHSANWSHIKF